MENNKCMCIQNCYLESEGGFTHKLPHVALGQKIYVHPQGDPPMSKKDWKFNWQEFSELCGCSSEKRDKHYPCKRLSDKENY